MVGTKAAGGPGLQCRKHSTTATGYLPCSSRNSKRLMSCCQYCTALHMRHTACMDMPLPLAAIIRRAVLLPHFTQHMRGVWPLCSNAGGHRDACCCVTALHKPLLQCNPTTASAQHFSCTALVEYVTMPYALHRPLPVVLPSPASSQATAVEAAAVNQPPCANLQGRKVQVWAGGWLRSGLFTH